ncbi:MAG: hypothetical protein AAF604_16345 [Acidobacteriota bacterium]
MPALCSLAGPRPRNTLLLTLVLLMMPAAGAHGATATDAFLPDLITRPQVADGDQTRSEEAVVRDLYRSLGERVRGSGYEFEIELDRFITTYRRDFGRLPAISEVVTPLSGSVLEIASRQLEVPSAKRTFVRYEPSWQWLEADAPPPAIAAGTAIAGFVSHQPGAGRAVALTRFRAQVRALGQQRTYQAAVLWRQDVDGALELTVLDNIVPRVAEARLVKAEATVHRDLAKLAGSLDVGSPEDVVTSLFGASGSCAETSDTEYESKVRTDAKGHVTGRHRLLLDAAFTCSCDSSCRSRCEPNGTVSCSDTGFTSAPYIHRTASASADILGISSGGNQSSCRAKATCAVERCFYGVCGGVSVSYSGANARITGSTFWTKEVEIPMICNGCEEGDNPGNGGGNSGGGNGSGNNGPTPDPGDPGNGPDPGNGGGGWHCVDVNCDDGSSASACGYDTGQILQEAWDSCPPPNPGGDNGPPEEDGEPCDEIICV